LTFLYFFIGFWFGGMIYQFVMEMVTGTFDEESVLTLFFWPYVLFDIARTPEDDTE